MFRRFLICVALFPPALSGQEAVREAASKPAIKTRQVVKMSAATQRLVDASVERGLAWLAKQQNAKGFWGGVVGTKERDRYDPIAPIELQTKHGTGHIGVTSLCGMAFLSGGHLPGRGKYGKVVKKAVDAVLMGMKNDGLITMAGSQMYTHAFATLFLAEVYGMKRDEKIKKGLERAVHMVVDCQNALGGWRYHAFSKEADISVTVTQLQALRAARNIGIEVPKTTIDRAVEFVKSCRITWGSSKGRYSYNSERRKKKTDSYSIQAAAVTSLVSAGIYDPELIDPVMEFLEEEMEEVMRRYPHHFFFYYGNYYAAQAFFHADQGTKKGCFQRYYDAIRGHLLDGQKDDGRWPNPKRHGPGEAFSTAVACILLQIPNQYLPIFQR